MVQETCIKTFAYSYSRIRSIEYTLPYSPSAKLFNTVICKWHRPIDYPAIKALYNVDGGLEIYLLETADRFVTFT